MDSGKAETRRINGSGGSYIHGNVSGAGVGDDNDFGVAGKFSQNLDKTIIKSDVDVENVGGIRGSRTFGRYAQQISGPQ